MKLTRLIKENEEPRPLSPEVKRHFLEMISTYNKYQEMMDRKSDIAQVAETLGGITEAAKTLLLGESDDWFDKVTIKRNMSELDKLGKEFDKCATEANSLDQRLHGLYEDMGHILSRYYKMGEITEDQMKERLGIRESLEEVSYDSQGNLKAKKQYKSVSDYEKDAKKGDYVWVGNNPNNFKGAGKELLSKVLGKDSEGNVILTPFGRNKKYTIPQKNQSVIVVESITEAGEDVNKAVIPSDVKMKLQRALDVLTAKKLTYPQKLQVMGRVLDSLGIDKKELSKTTSKLRSKLESKVNEDTELIRLGEEVEKLMEKNCPTDPAKWSASKSAAKKKFDVYPSAYANGWASKNYKEKGGSWRKCKD
jgi:hypothetical protein